MQLDEVLKALGVEDAAEVLQPYWDDSEATLSADPPSFLQPEQFLADREYAAVPAEVDPLLTEIAAQVRSNSALLHLAWHCYRLLYEHRDYPGGQIRQWPTLAHILGEHHGVFYLLIALGTVPLMRAAHAQRGIPDEVSRGVYGNFQECMGNYATLNNGAWGVDLRVLYWLRNQTAGDLYRLNRLEFMVRPFHGQIRAYRHRHSGEVVALAEEGVFYTPEGFINGGATPENTPEGFTSQLTVMPEKVTGNLISPLGHATQEIVELPLVDWECVLQRGDHILEMHIPGGGGMTPEKTADSMRRALDFFPRYFPEKSFVGFGCSSWILNPDLEDFYSPASNMVLWQHEMYLYPVMSGGKDGLHFLFATDQIDLHTAPRDTSVRRAVLDHLLAGHRLRSGGAFLLKEDFQYFGTQHYRSQPRFRRNDNG